MVIRQHRFDQGGFAGLARTKNGNDRVLAELCLQLGLEVSRYHLLSLNHTNPEFNSELV